MRDSADIVGVRRRRSDRHGIRLTAAIVISRIPRQVDAICAA